jgi:hypothetical protein
MAAGLLNERLDPVRSEKTKGGEPMIRAIFRDGQIQPLDPLPAEWEEGRELQIIEGDPIDDPEAIERWCRELDSIANRPDDPAGWEKFEFELAKADHYVKSSLGDRPVIESNADQMASIVPPST